MGVPAAFLRLDLLSTSGRTAAETEAALNREGFDPTEVRQVIGAYLTATPSRTGGDVGGSDYWFTNAKLDQVRARLRARLSR